MYTTDDKHCDYPIRRTTIVVDGFPRETKVWCAQTVGLASYTGRDGETWIGCPRHIGAVRLAHPAMPRCACPALVHGPGGCREDAVPHPEDDEPMPCHNCMGWRVVGYHASELRAMRVPRPATAEEIEEMAADYALIRDEFGGSREALYGKRWSR